MSRSRKEKSVGDSSFINKLIEQRNVKKNDSFSKLKDLSTIERNTSKPLIMSTPKRPTRQSQCLDQSADSSDCHSQNGSITSQMSQKKFHSRYDPDIELRQVQDRFSKRNSKSWADQSLLNDEEDEDLQKYSEKIKKSNKNVKLEQDTEVLTRRQTDLDKGKVKQCYKNYVYEIDKVKRKPFMPKTPNKFMKMSRRAWDGAVRKWKKHIHAWNEPNFDELYANGTAFDCCSESSFSTKGSINSIENNLEREEELIKIEEEEDTLQAGGAMRTRKRTVQHGKENLGRNDEEATLEEMPKSDCSKDLHCGLTNDAAALSVEVGPIKRRKLSNTSK